VGLSVTGVDLRRRVTTRHDMSDKLAAVSEITG
jgi:hypothetical protein